MDPLKILASYYDTSSRLYKILLTHSECVARKAIECIRRKGIEADTDFVYEAAMLHDIGIIECDAESIDCHGREPYIRHGVIGTEMLRRERLPRHALVCERHTGSGITRDEIISEGMPLPHRDLLPVSIEEKAICYADKFFSKSRTLDEEKPVEKIIAQMYAHGKASGERFEALHRIFSL